MSRLSLTNLEPVRNLQQQTTQEGALSKFAPGDILRAQVVRSLGDGLYTLNVRGSEIVTSSATPLAAGQILTLQVSRNDSGQASSYLLTVMDGAIAAAQGRPNAGTLENNQLVNSLGQSIGLGTNAATAESAQAGLAPTALPAESLEALPTGPQLDPRVAQILRPDGPVARLLAQRPDLAPRINELLATLLERPEGIGKGLEQLTAQLDQLSGRLNAGQQATLAPTLDRLAGQLLGADLLQNSQNLAEALADRLGPIARGLEGAIARGISAEAAATATATATIVQGAAPSPSLAPRMAELAGELVGFLRENSAPVSPQGQAELARQFQQLLHTQSDSLTPEGLRLLSRKLGALAEQQPDPAIGQRATQLARGIENIAARQAVNEPLLASLTAIEEVAAPTSPASARVETIQGAFDGDLKGQLLELRSRLTEMAANEAAPAASIRQAVGRTDMLLDQVTGQQIRNVEGLNQYLYAELPMKSDSGIGEARLSVFYRGKGNGQSADPDRFTVALFLNLTRLGDVIAVVSAIDQAVSVAFTVENPAVEKMIGEQGNSLREALAAAGHTAATVTVRQVPPKGTGAAGEQVEEIWSAFMDTLPTSSEAGRRLNVEA